MGFGAGEFQGRVSFLPVFGVSPQVQHNPAPDILLFDGVTGKQVPAYSAQDGSLNTAVGHLRLHILAHARGFSGVCVVGKSLTERGCKRVGHWI